MFCSNCGTQNIDSAKFCMSCGSPLQTVPVVPATPAAPAEPVVPVETQPAQIFVQPEQTYSQPVVQAYAQPVFQPEPVKAKSTPRCLPIIAHLTMVLGAVLLALVLFLPILSANDGYRMSLEMFGDMEYIDGYTGKDLADLSPVELIGIYFSDDYYDEEVGLIFLGVALFFGLFAFLNLLFSGIRKPIPVFVFTTLSFLVGILQEDCYKLEELVGYRYDWGISHILLYIGAAIAVGGGIFYLIVRRKPARAYA